MPFIPNTAKQQQQMLAGVQDWRDLAQRVAHQLTESDSATNHLLGNFASELQEAPDQRLREAGDLCAQAESLLQDAAMACLNVGESLHSDPQALELCEQRLTMYVDLMRKHGGTARSLLEAWEALKRQLDMLEHSDERIKKLTG